MKVLLVLAVGVIYAVVATDTSNVQEWIDYRLVREGGTDPPNPSPVNCTAPGKICHGCKDVYLCKNTTGTWKPQWLQTCEDQQTCNAGVCTDIPTPECALEGKPFKCVSIEGVYPDPGVCTRFYYCVPDGTGVKQIDSSCGENSKYAYNPRTTYCDIALVNGKCPATSSVPVCKTPAQTGAFKENPSMYYICEPYQEGENVLYPFIYICPNGGSYDNNYGCKSK